MLTGRRREGRRRNGWKDGTPWEENKEGGREGKGKGREGKGREGKGKDRWFVLPP
jgi:hypothetical protein